MSRILFPLGLLLALAGYFGPWINHPAAAGLIVTGLDLGEIVKFLPDVRSGVAPLWRPGFYAPLAAIGIAALLGAYRPSLAARWPLRLLALAVVVVAAANLVPPAWTPARLLEPEFRVQTTTLVLLLVGLALSPWLALTPQRLAATLVSLGVAAALILPLYGLLQTLPAFSDLYRRSLSPAWGPWIMACGLGLLAIAYWLPTPPISPTSPVKETAHAPRRDE